MNVMTALSRRGRAARIGIVATSLAALLPLGVGRASAVPTVTKQCTETNTFTFTPPLTLTNLSGSASLLWVRTCVVTTITASPPGESVQVITDSSTSAETYFGDCALALLSGGSVHALIGGTVLVYAEAGAQKTQVLVPDQPCTGPIGETTASGSGTKTEEAP